MATRTTKLLEQEQKIEPLTTTQAQGIGCSGSGRRVNVERTRFGTVYSCIKCGTIFPISQVGNMTYPTAPEHKGDYGEGGGC